MTVDERKHGNLAFPHSFGWLLIERDPKTGQEFWEMPNGDKYIHHGITPLMLPIPPRSKEFMRRIKSSGKA